MNRIREGCKIKILCVSDIHGHLVDLPLSKECDAIIISGDICPTFDHAVEFQYRWYMNNFLPWCRSLNKDVYFTFGNHDFFAEKIVTPSGLFTFEEYRDGTEIVGAIDNTIYIKNNLKIGFTPSSLPFGNWAFNYPEEKIEETLDSFGKCDIVVSHGPPFDLLDMTPRGEHVGSRALREYIDKNKPRLVVTAHIHHSRGIMNYGETLVVNASIVDEQCKVVNGGVLVEI